MAESLAHTATVPINMVGISLSKQVRVFWHLAKRALAWFQFAVSPRAP